jgi:TRAP-type mannitol/chloroaromatic compound transport system permease small subunit
MLLLQGISEAIKSLAILRGAATSDAETVAPAQGEGL